MRYAVVDGRIPEKCAAGLMERGYFPIFMPPFYMLDAPVASHPDMLLFFGDAIFCHSEYARAAAKELELMRELGILGAEQSKSTDDRSQQDED